MKYKSKSSDILYSSIIIYTYKDFKNSMNLKEYSHQGLDGVPYFEEMELVNYKIQENMISYICNISEKSHFGHQKDEVNIKSCETFDEFVLEIDNYIEYYNNFRY